MAARGDATRGTASKGSRDPLPDVLHERAASRLRAHDQRLTAGRVQLIEVLAATDRPLTIPEIRDARPGLAQSSVYRNLVVLEEAGVVHCLTTRDGFARYELAEDLTGHHHHLVCVTCGRIEDLPATPALERSVEAAVARAARTNGFRTEHHRLDFVGVCADCA
jgi:Fe2+ or Zn2+ uptake regulation protein